MEIVGLHFLLNVRFLLILVPICILLAPKRKVQIDMPSPEHEGNSLQYGGDDTDLSPPRQRQRQYHSPSPAPDTNLNSDLSPPHKRRYRNDTPSPEPPTKPSGEVSDLWSQRRQRKLHHSPSPEPDTKSKHSSGLHPDLSPPRRRRADTESSSPLPKLKPLREDTDLSPPRQQRRRHYSPSPKPESDLSPPRRSKKDVEGSGSPNNSQSSRQRSTQSGNSRASMAQDISTPGKTGKNHLVQLLQRNSQKLVWLLVVVSGKKFLKLRRTHQCCKFLWAPKVLDLFAHFMCRIFLISWLIK